MQIKRFGWFCGMLLATPLAAEETVVTPRPVPATRPQMKQLLEDLKSRPLRIPLPELTDEDRRELGDRADSYETRLRYHYLPAGEPSVFGGRTGSGRSDRSQSTPGSSAASRDFTRNADDNMTLSYQFKTMLFWIAARTNNCHYCLGHQEQKLSAVGMTDEQIAALDSDWSIYTPAEQAAFAYARKLTYEPHRLSDGDISRLQEYFTPLQILEMTMSVAGNNAINRWKEGAGIPQSRDGGNFFRRDGVAIPEGRPVPDKSFLTPTSPKFVDLISIVAPLDIADRRPTGQGVTDRPQLESREQVEEALAKARTREPRLPLVSSDAARQALGVESASGDLPNWMRLMANFPNESQRRLDSLLAIDSERGDLSLLLKAQVSWIVARQDRAWYAVGIARDRLKKLGQSDEQIFALDGDWHEFTPSERAQFRLARQLAACPIALSDADVADALHQASPREVVQLINFVTGRAYFNRVTEAAGLPLDP